MPEKYFENILKTKEALNFVWFESIVYRWKEASFNIKDLVVFQQVFDVVGVEVATWTSLCRHIGSMADRTMARSFRFNCICL